jgi:hypothetical protein
MGQFPQTKIWPDHEYLAFPRPSQVKSCCILFALWLHRFLRHVVEFSCCMLDLDRWRLLACDLLTVGYCCRAAPCRIFFLIRTCELWSVGLLVGCLNSWWLELELVCWSVADLKYANMCMLIVLMTWCVMCSCNYCVKLNVWSCYMYRCSRCELAVLCCN